MNRPEQIVKLEVLEQAPQAPLDRETARPPAPEKPRARTGRRILGLGALLLLLGALAIGVSSSRACASRRCARAAARGR